MVRKASFAWYALLALSLAAVGCGKKTDEADKDKTDKAEKIWESIIFRSQPPYASQALLARAQYLIDKGVPPQRILLLTFTRRAAAEMLQRAGQMIGEASAGKVWGGTFHAVANRLLRVYGKTIGLIGGMSWESSAEYYRLINTLVKERLGGFHSAKCVMISVDFAEIETLQREDRWAESAQVLIAAAQGLERAGADLVDHDAHQLRQVGRGGRRGHGLRYRGQRADYRRFAGRERHHR